MRLSDETVRDLIDEAKRDEVGLWMIHSIVRDHASTSDPPARRAATMDSVRRMLESEEVVAGCYNPDRSGRVDPWKISTAETLARIESEWDELGQDPSGGDIVVFVGKDHR